MVRLVLLFLALLVGCDSNAPTPLPVSLVPSSPASRPQQDDGLTEARTKLARLEERRAEIQQLVERTSDERDRLVAQLHELGVKSSSDLKGNLQAASYAESLQRTALELQSLQRDAARFDMAIHQAKELIRRLERSSALEGFDDELATVAEQVMQLDESLGSAAPLDPIQQAAILDQELQRQAASPTSTLKEPGEFDSRLVGKWEIVEGEQEGHVQFTSGGTVIFVWFHPGLKENWTQTGKYRINGNALEIQASGEYGGKSVRDFELLSDDELIIHKPEGLDFTWLFGRLKRVPNSEN